MVKFAYAGNALDCAVTAIQNHRRHGGGICTKATVPVGTHWNVKNASGHNYVYGTPVRVSQRMTMHAVKNTMLIDAKDKEPAVEWLEREALRHGA